MERTPTIICIACGVVCHIVFNRLEPRRGSIILALILAPPTLIAGILSRASSRGIVRTPLAIYTTYIATLVISVVAYRLSPFHPLATFPGPTICKVTRLWAFYMVQTGNQHRYYKTLHARYGLYVRTGPNFIHVSDADALPTVMGIKPFRRGDRYGITNLEGTTGSLLSMTDTQEHAQRRRIWDRSMNTSAVQGYRNLLSGRLAQLVDVLEKRQGLDLDIASWLSFFSFDFMGDLAFGGAFRLMEQGSDAQGYMHLSRMGAKFREKVGTVPWIRPFQSILPSSKDRTRFREFSEASVRTRKTQGSTRKDIFYHLLDEDGNEHEPLSFPTLIMESELAIVAGSDTTGTALSNIFFYLLSNPEVLARLQAEIDRIFPPGADVFAPAIGEKMELLDAVINETLRLQPVVPNGIQRLLPMGSGGTMVAGHWIPEGTTVQVSTYCVHRDPRYPSPDPDSFCPERWLEKKPVSKLNLAAYFPFSYGPTSCAGKNLALLEMHMVVCSLLHKFEFELASGWKHREWERNLADNFILVKGELPVRMKVRK